jgi:hypothetical protein
MSDVTTWINNGSDIDNSTTGVTDIVGWRTHNNNIIINLGCRCCDVTGYYEQFVIENLDVRLWRLSTTFVWLSSPRDKQNIFFG